MLARLQYIAKVFAVGCVSATAFLGLLVLGLYLVLRYRQPADVSLHGVRCLEIADEAAHFRESSGVALPDDAQIILSCDDHSGFNWDGEYYVVFETTPEQASAYLEATPWTAEWQR